MSVKKPNGAAVSAFLSAMVGLLTLGITNVGDDASSSFSMWLLSVGKLWVPNAQGIGPYSGKETLLLLTWLLSWIILHFALRKRQVKLAVPVVVFLVGLALATMFIYTPFVDFMLGH